MKDFDQSKLEKEELIALALLKRSSEITVPKKEFKDNLLSHLEEKYYKEEKKENFWQAIQHFFAYSTKVPALVASFMIVVIGFGMTSSYAYLSPNVNRNHRLYNLKRIIERIEYSLAFSDESKMIKQLEFAGKRQQEVQNTYMEESKIDQQSVKEIVNNLSQAYEFTNNIKDKKTRKQSQLIIAKISKDVIKDLSKIVDDIEKDKVKVKRIEHKEPVIEEIKKDIINIKEKTITVPVITTPPTPKCNDECEDLNRDCLGQGFRVCGDFDDDDCTEWGEVNECVEGTKCKEGTCVESCESECIMGDETSVSGGKKICGDYDEDECTEWSPVIAIIEPTQTPSVIAPEPEPIPVPAQKCRSNCKFEGERSCSGNGYQICGNYDTDSCLEWGDVNACSSFEECINGACVNNTPSSCTDECDSDSSRQCSGNGYQICGNYDSDSCLEWGETNECPGETSCDNGACV